MIHLVQATELTRKILKYTGITLASIFTIIILYNITLFLKSIFFPPKASPIEQTFGNLPPPEFPLQGAGITYKLNTVNGMLPVFPDRFKVYKMKEHNPNLLDLKTARAKVAGVRLSANETKLGKSLYQWTSKDPPERFLRYDVISEHFELASNYLTNENVLLAKHVPNDKGAKRVVSSFLARIGADTSDIDENKTQLTYFKIINGKVQRVPSLNETQIVRVDLFQQPVNKIEIYYPYTYPNESVIRFWIGSGTDSPTIFEASFIHQIVDTTFSSDYPILTSQEAFQALKDGRAYVFNPEKKSEIEVIDISLGYYIGETPQKYLIPIVVFKGKNFKAYVSAVKQ